MINVTDESFKKEVLDSALPVLVDFWAPWCNPCKMIAPLVDQAAKDYAKKIKVCKVNIDESSKIASHYGIMSIPTLMFFKQGKVSGQVVGSVSKTDLKKAIEGHL